MQTFEGMIQIKYNNNFLEKLTWLNYFIIFLKLILIGILVYDLLKLEMWIDFIVNTINLFKVSRD